MKMEFVYIYKCWILYGWFRRTIDVNDILVNKTFWCSVKDNMRISTVVIGIIEYNFQALLTLGSYKSNTIEKKFHLIFRCDDSRKRNKM